MLLGEPPRTPYDLNFPLLGIPVRVSPWFWLAAVLLAYRLPDAGPVLTWIAAVFLSILVHELGHAVVVRAYGFQPWIVLHGFGGLTSFDQRYAPRSRGSDTLGQVLISAAGPAAGFLLAGLLVLTFVLAGYGRVLITGGWHVSFTIASPHSRLGFYIVNMCAFILDICLIWGLVNLLPVYPLDGGQIARELFLKFSPSDGIRRSLLLSMFVAGAMAAFGWVKWHDIYVALFFGYLAYSSFATLQAYSDRRPW